MSCGVCDAYDSADDYAALVSGVSSLNTGGSSSTLVVYGETAFPVVAETSSVIAAAGCKTATGGGCALLVAGLRLVSLVGLGGATDAAIMRIAVDCAVPFRGGATDAV